MRKIAVFIALILASWPAAAQTPGPDPNAARLVTEDLERFWEAFDKAGPEFPAEPFQKLYLDRGTPGLQDFIQLRITSADKLAETVREFSKYYASTRESLRHIPETEKAVRATFHALKEIYPDAVFPDVYIVFGRLTTGGTTSDRGLLIGAEMWGRTPESPMDGLDPWFQELLRPIDRIPHIVAHELIHYQQRTPTTQPTLLGQAIREGSADFIGELIAGNHINEAVHRWSPSREAELWKEFSATMHGTDYGPWFYKKVPDRPNDVGYWIGYQITKAYYDRAADKKQALKDILRFEDPADLLAKSGYADKFKS